jgi:dipeptidase E
MAAAINPARIHLLLISSSRVRGSGWLDLFADEIDAFLGPRIRRALFVPFALADHDGYHRKARERFAAIGIELDSLHEPGDAREKVRSAQAVVVGGGNTFRLLATLQTRGLLDGIAERGRSGMPYVGWSAGSNLACPTIKTTNDMPIVEPASFDALGLVPFQINPHYQDPASGSTHMGETRETRIREFHEENDAPVVGLREGAMLRVLGDAVELRGRAGARIFRRGQEPVEVAPVARIENLLQDGA